MVQTEQQYICIHQCLMAVLEGKENTGPPREIHDNQGYEGECRCQSTSVLTKIMIFDEIPRSFRYFNPKA